MTTSIYDAASRQVASMDALGVLTTAVFDAASRQIASQDALGFAHTTNYDAASRVTISQEALDNTTLIDNLEVSFRLEASRLRSF